MTTQESNTQQQEPVPASPVQDKAPREEAGRKRAWSLGRMFQSMLDGTFLTKENIVRSIPYFFFLTLVGLVYISNSYFAEKMVRTIDRTKRDLKELRYEHITAKSELMYISKQSEVARRLEYSGLKESTYPPEKLVAGQDSDSLKTNSK